MDGHYEERLVNHAILVNKIRNQLLSQAEITKQNAFAAREATIKQRTETINKVRERLQVTTELIKDRHESISRKINQEAIHRDANIRVNRGLEALEKFIQVLRESDMNSDIFEKAIRDPIISKTLKSEARKAFASDFFKSIQRQLLMQTEFINIAAHELRTPIMPILMNTEILESEIGDKYEEVRLIARNARRLERLTQNILNVARIESGTLKLNTERFDLNQIVAGIVKDETARLESKEVQIIHMPPAESVFVHADKDRMTQVVSNLLSNALKFTQSGLITVSTKVVDGEAVTDVTDGGTGISAEIMPLLFSKFATKSDRGTGLGLYICKNIIEVHGGRMWARNNPTGGATFGFSLPIAASITNKEKKD
ncbi:ATP-binding protein [Candidatus Nitrosotenuis cloacae]|uniref:ATP-binding protein n=1 Tax=Candidatus Nitrosotenuis cloacae TaxID=1603555 RepID=UPI00227E843B|nr:ATP-binding protein [Candidatus Nitrosotenuis cloacae]